MMVTTSEAINIVLVDDHAVVRAGLRELLNGYDKFCVVGEADSGESVIELLGKCRPDVIIMDLNMPGIGGIEAIRSIKKIRTEVLIIVLTVNASEPHLTQVIKAGGQGCLSKQCDPGELINAIETVIYGKPYISNEMQRVTSENQDNVSVADFNLTTREFQMLQFIAQGKDLSYTAKSLGLSYKTVHHHRKSLMDKIKAKNNFDIAEFARNLGLNNT